MKRDVVGMIRFVIKSALALGLLAMVVPLGTASRPDGASLDLFGVLDGVRAGVADLGGFCTRAPAACDAGRQIATFAGERIEAGLRVGYEYLNGQLEPAAATHAASEVAAASNVSPDPLTTGAVETPAGPRPYLPPRPVRQAVAVPTPAPRG